MIIKLGKVIYNKCSRFADKRMESSKGLYHYRGESNISKMKTDIIIGTLGEFGVCKHMTEDGYDCSEPDLNIYESRRKSFDADLYSDEINIHVKSQGVVSAKRYGNSWLFQRSDSLVKYPKDNDLLCFTNVDVETKEVTILGFCWASDIVDNDRFEECKVFRYRHTKVALYVKNLEDLIFQL